MVLASNFDEIEVYVNGVLDSSSSSVSNVATVTVNTSTVDTSVDNMGGGINGFISGGIALDYGNNNFVMYLIGDFNSVGGNSNFYDFAIWLDNGSLGWDTCNAQLLGYDGYYPSAVTLISGNVLRVTLSTVANAYGGIVDDSSGWQAIPWTTQTIEWNISGENWQNWN